MMFFFVNITQVWIFIKKKKGDRSYENYQICVLVDTTFGIKPCL